MSSEGQNYWNQYFVGGINIKARPFDRKNFLTSPNLVPPHFWNDFFKTRTVIFPTYKGYSEARDLIGQGTPMDIERLSFQASNIVTEVFANIDDRQFNEQDTTKIALVKLRLSDDLERWKNSQQKLGNVLPPKKPGLTKVSQEILDIYRATEWPEALKTNNALFGCGLASFLIGAADAPTMFSNYVTNMVFYYEHGYDHLFPSLQIILNQALSDQNALKTLGGLERRVCVETGRHYIQGKIDLEKRHKLSLAYRSARINRREAQITSFLESSLMGMGAEAMAQGYDPAAVFTDLLFSSPGTDVIDVGSDLLNSEVMNSFLNVKDVTDTGVVTEEALRKIYDAFATVGARMLTERWNEPVARMSSALYTWHIQNDRHMFLRRAILGWPKARKVPARPQREADFDEAFDEHYRTTGFSRPLDSNLQCNGQDTCDFVKEFFARNNQMVLLRNLWSFLVIRPLEYVRRGKVDEKQEDELVEGSRLLMARLFVRGFVLEMTWLIAHANHHAWQVNYLFEAAMFGSILDGGELIGKLDRQEELVIEN